MILEKIKDYENLFPKNSIIDGVIDGTTYIQSKIKIAWFLKEGYSNEKEGFHIKKHYGQDEAYENFFKKIATQTWHPIIYSSYGILNCFIEYDDMDFIKDKPEMCEIVESIAIINANKFASKTGTHTTPTNLKNGFNDCKSIIEKQIEVLQPQIHVFCSTFYLYKDLFGLTEKHKMTHSKNFENCTTYLKEGKLFLDVYHPANTTQKREDYINQIIKVSKIWATKFSSL